MPLSPLPPELTHPQKQVVFGKLPPELRARCQASELQFGASATLAGKSIHFSPGHSLNQGLAGYSRSLERFDFTTEWNNLGYGRITLDGASRWSISEALLVPEANSLGQLIDESQRTALATYCAVWDFPDHSVLWFNREAGPIDGFEWVIIENFLSNYREGELANLPVISEIPWGYDAAATMRIDCDEAIASGRRLFELYRSRGLPFSLAIKTGQAIGEADQTLIHDVVQAGGAVVTHSHTHRSDWGGSRENTLFEVAESQRILKGILGDDYNWDYAVSPFHQNSQTAVAALREAGLKGFVGGIIHNDPEYLQFRAGPAFEAPGILTHSQQCMLHGDCYHDAGNSLQVYKKSFDLHRATETFFGFLDHPFSAYSYGWSTEEERLGAHAEFLDHLSGTGKVWFAHLIDALDFLRKKSEARVRVNARGELETSIPFNRPHLPALRIRWKGQTFRAG